MKHEFTFQDSREEWNVSTEPKESFRKAKSYEIAYIMAHPNLPSEVRDILLKMRSKVNALNIFPRFTDPDLERFNLYILRK